jgi:hypothetical protein
VNKGAIIQADSVRAFKPGQYVNTSDGFTAYVYDDNGLHEENRPYQVAICEHDEERCYSASELTMWIPKAGDGVVEANCGDGEIGQFLHTYGDDTSVVKWKSFPLPEIRLNSSLEPIWTD